LDDRKNTHRLLHALAGFSVMLGSAQLAVPGAMNKLIGASDNPRSRAVQRWLGGARETAAGIAIESSRNPVGPLCARVAGDALDLALLGSLCRSRTRPPTARRRAALAAAAVVGVTVADVVAVNQARRNGAAGLNRRTGDIEAKAAVTVNKPRGEVFAYWNNVENVATFMAHLESVRSLVAGRSRWRAVGPAGTNIEWETEITDCRPDELIAWQSAGDTAVPNRGQVEFRPAPGDRGTEVHVRLCYRPPAGKMGSAIATLFGAAADQQVRDDLRRFKQVMETGEVVRSGASPEGTLIQRRFTQRPAQPSDR
jgi:uncharacterized membrane protein